MMPTGSGGMCVADGESMPLPFPVPPELIPRDDDGDDEKNAPLKSALVLGAEATRRRKRLADDPPPLPLLGLGLELVGDWSVGNGGIRNEDCVGLAVCGIGEPGALACLSRRALELEVGPLYLSDTERGVALPLGCRPVDARRFSLPPPVPPVLHDRVLPGLAPALFAPGPPAAAPNSPAWPK